MCRWGSLRSARICKVTSFDFDKEKDILQEAVAFVLESKGRLHAAS